VVCNDATTTASPITAHILVNCCIGKPHDPLPSLLLQEEDIKDKAKLTSLEVYCCVATILAYFVRDCPSC
jgi:hypothetical protein